MPVRRIRLKLGALLLGAAMCTPALADETPAPTVVPGSGLDAVEVIPIRQREVWFRDDWTVRANGGWATEKTLGEITSGGVRREKDRPGLIEISVGRPIVDDFHDWPLHVGWRMGLIRYFERGAQPDFFGHTLYLKAYWTGFPWSGWLRTRAGFGEGMSYAWHVPSEERDEARRHDRNTSRLLNYLDVSLEVNAGDFLQDERLKGCWLGWVISHRSGAFGLIDVFGSVNGGSNYNTASIECDF